jgi:hypothetical protein
MATWLMGVGVAAGCDFPSVVLVDLFHGDAINRGLTPDSP